MEIVSVVHAFREIVRTNAEGPEIQESQNTALRAVTLYVGILNFGSLSICYAASTAHIATRDLEALSS
jgi:hypothetical protein